MKKIISLLFIFLTFLVNAQDNLLLLPGHNNEPIYVAYMFKGTKLINGQSVKLTDKGVLQFTIQHRFGALNSGFYNLFGLDDSQVRLGFDYGLKDWLSVGIGRSSTLKTIDINGKIRLKRQSKGNKIFPFTIAANTAVFIKQYKYADTQLESFLFTNQLSFSNQFLFARKINRNLTIQLSPTIVHYNLVESADESNDKFSFGIGARQKLTNHLSVNIECFPQLNDKENNNFFSLGFDIQTGGHVFQLHLSNSPAMIEPGFITKTTGNWLDGDIYFGFNVSRVFSMLNK